MIFYHMWFIKMDKPRLCLRLSLSHLLGERRRSSVRQVLRLIKDKPANLNDTNLWEERITFPPSTPSPSSPSLSTHTHTNSSSFMTHYILCVYTPSTFFPFSTSFFLCCSHCVCSSTWITHLHSVIPSPCFLPADAVSWGVLLQQSINLPTSATIAIFSPTLPRTPAADLRVCEPLPVSGFFCVSPKWLTTGSRISNTKSCLALPFVWHAFCNKSFPSLAHICCCHRVLIDNNCCSNKSYRRSCEITLITNSSL